MTGMWMVDPEYLCRKHLLGEHNELHRITGHLKRGNLEVVLTFSGVSQVDTSLIEKRHNDLAKEMDRRGYSHESPREVEKDTEIGEVDVEKNLEDLKSRCDKCRRRIE